MKKRKSQLESHVRLSDIVSPRDGSMHVVIDCADVFDTVDVPPDEVERADEQRLPEYRSPAGLRKMIGRCTSSSRLAANYSCDFG